jgi:hypothetical protein
MTKTAGGVVHYPVTPKEPRADGLRLPLCAVEVYGKGDTLARPGCADKISCPACLELIAQQKLEKVFGSQFDPD